MRPGGEFSREKIRSSDNLLNHVGGVAGNSGLDWFCDGNGCGSRCDFPCGIVLKHGAEFRPDIAGKFFDRVPV